ncbi:Hypothetical predicted protein [Pelobates cultripes]|uniref:Uncharacterized protein n=1 Tax=Pelobates cultripes TaxID=61616 RepID=A0AAD1RXQ2_PELCU|nr:Hypothetical predicted protein [Pelobates cultripes]
MGFLGVPPAVGAAPPHVPPGCPKVCAHSQVLCPIGPGAAPALPHHQFAGVGFTVLDGPPRYEFKPRCPSLQATVCGSPQGGCKLLHSVDLFNLVHPVLEGGYLRGLPPKWNEQFGRI